MAAIAVWSTWGLAIRWLGKPAVVVTFYNSLFALVFQGVAIWWLTRRGHEGVKSGWGLPAFALGLFGLVNTLTFFYALKTATVATALLTHYTAPVFVAVIAPFVVGDKMTRGTLMALVASTAGLGLVFSHGALGGGELLGAISGTVSGVAYAFVIVSSRKLSATCHPIVLASAQGVVTVAALGPFVVSSPDVSLSLSQAGLLALLALTHSTVAVAVYIRAMKVVTAQEAGVLGYLEPVLATLLAAVFLAERPTALMAAGGAMVVFSGVALAFAPSSDVSGGTV